jgi:hypothetical protein
MSSSSASVRPRACNSAAESVVLGAFGLAEHASELARLFGLTQSMIAGGAALTWWKASMHPLTTTVPKGQDLDIWVRVPTIPRYPIEEILLDLYANLLCNKAGYHRQTYAERREELRARRAAGEFGASSEDLMYAPAARYIRQIQNFIHPTTGRKIQLILVSKDKVTDVLDTYDLDICRFSIRAQFSSASQSLDAELGCNPPPGATEAQLDDIYKGRMRLFNTKTNVKSSTLKRIEKYYGRGYHFVETVACPTCSHCGGPRKLTVGGAILFARQVFDAPEIARIAEGLAIARNPTVVIPAFIDRDEEESDFTPPPPKPVKKVTKAAEAEAASLKKAQNYVETMAKQGVRLVIDVDDSDYSDDDE